MQPITPPNEPGKARPETNASNGAAVQALSDALVKKVQATGQINVLEIELKCFLLAEAVTMLTELVIELSAGKHTDESATAAMTARVEALTKNINDSVKAAPRLVVPGAIPPSRVNSSKHN